jgi:hypothetical protein
LEMPHAIALLIQLHVRRANPHSIAQPSQQQNPFDQPLFP